VADAGEVSRQQPRRDHTAFLFRKRWNVALDWRIEIDASGFVQLEETESSERLGDARNAESSLARDRNAMLEIGITQILSDYSLAAQHHEGAQPDISLSPLNVGDGILERLTLIAACRQPRRPLRSYGQRRSARSHHQKEEEPFPHETSGQER
jgi:hypothetical protein